MNLAKLLSDAVVGVLRKVGLIERSIVDVEEWDGSAANYSSTQAYCDASLLNVNAAAGKDDPEDWAQSHCKLPVRREEDDSDVFVRQAVFAAAGGRGISAVERPDDVPEEAWDSAVTAAANKIIAAYKEMDEVAPDNVFEAAGKEPPEERAINSWRLYDKLWDEIYAEHDAYLVDVFHDAGGMYAIANREGALWKFAFETTDEDVILGESVVVTEVHSETTPRGFTISRQADGTLRWIAIACTAILNRDSEIDSRALFDDFVERFNDGETAQLDLYHIDGSDVGDVDYVARDGFTLLASGTFHDSELAQAVARGLEANPDPWGTSILYKPAADPQIISVAGVDIPVYDAGILRKITVLKEQRAAALFTTIQKRGLRMDEKIKADLLELVGDEELVDGVGANVDAVNNRAADDGVIARETEESEPETETETSEPVSEVEGIQQMQARIAALHQAVETLNQIIVDSTTSAENAAQTIEERLHALELSEQERHAAWSNDLPRVQSLQEIHQRPRIRNADETEDTRTADELAREEFEKAKKGA